MKYELPDEQTIEHILSLNYSRAMEKVMESSYFSAYSDIGMREEFLESARKSIIEGQDLLVEMLGLAPRDRLMRVCSVYHTMELFSPYINRIVTLLVVGRDEKAWGVFQSLKEDFGEVLPNMLDHEGLVWLDVRT